MDTLSNTDLSIPRIPQRENKQHVSKITLKPTKKKNYIRQNLQIYKSLRESFVYQNSIETVSPQLISSKESWE